MLGGVQTRELRGDEGIGGGEADRPGWRYLLQRRFPGSRLAWPSPPPFSRFVASKTRREILYN